MATNLSISNPSPRKLPGPQLLHTLICTAGKDDAVAIEHTFENGTHTSLTYEDFHSRADALARRITFAIQHSTTKPTRTVVPLLIPQCPDLYISQLAILKAGAAFCPIVLDSPEERLRFILKDVEATVLLTTSNFKPQLPSLDGVEIVAVDEESAIDQSVELCSAVDPADASYIMYTSGSTGQPKGVVLSHSAATQALLAHDKHIPQFRRFLQFASPTFDVSVFEIFFPWLRGMTLVSCDRRRLLNHLPGVINDLRIDACELTPSVASNLLRTRDHVPGLKVLLTIGEMLKPSVVESFGGDESEEAILHGMYGPTEATIHCTLQTNFGKNMTCNSIGIPLDTVSAFVIRAIDGALTTTPEILAIGEEGELAVGGYQLADGYLNRDEQTQKAFVQHPEYGTLYRTGDRARMLPNGTFECLGRISSGQVKLRGQRIELGEIEHAAARTPGCTDVAAEVVANTLVVFCVTESKQLSRDAVTSVCRKWLPEYMVPGDVVLMDSFPYLASGKCDRKVLRARYEERQAAAVAKDDSVQSEEMQQVLDCLNDVLGSQVFPTSSLAACGLDSLSSIRLAAALRKRGLARLDAGRVLTARTPSDILAISKEQDLTEDTANWREETQNSYRARLDSALSAAIDADAQDVETSFPCTPLQVAMLTETAKSPRAYCNWVKFALPSCSDASLLRQSLMQLAQSHQLLRSGFVATPSLPQSYATVVWRSLAEHQIVESAETPSPFQITADSDLLRPMSFQIRPSQNGFELTIQIHHALYDQWSMDLLQNDLTAILAGSSPLASQSFQAVADYYLHAETLSAQTSLEFWQDQLRNVSPTSLPLLRATHAENALQRTSWQSTSIQSVELKKRSQELGCSAPAILQTAMGLILGAYSGVSDVVLGSVFSGRTLPIDDIDNVFGPCLATLPLRIDSKAARTCKDLLGTVTDRNRQIQNHLLTTPTAIREAAGVAPGVGLFDSLLVWQETTMASQSTRELVVELDSEDQLEFNFVLEIDPTPTALRIRATYQQRLLSTEQVDMLIKQIESVAKQLFSDAEGLVEMLYSKLNDELLSIYNPEPKNYAMTFELTEEISRRASFDPARSAIRFATRIDDQSIDSIFFSYQELDERANRMAHELIAAGLQPEGLVCICMEKCIDLYVAMLASFKAGAGYLPLVPETPAARVKSILKQANVNLCVCDAQTSSSFRSMTDATILDFSNLDLALRSHHAPKVSQIGSRIAYMVFTSGSTGEPKGVAVTMDNLKGNIAVLAELYKVAPGDRLLQSCSQAFDVSVFEIFFTFYTGMCLCSATKDVLFRDFEQSIRAFEITHLSLTPTVAALAKPENVPSVKFLVTAGEGITEKVHRTWAGRGLNQGYGPSETTNICSVHMHVSPNDVLGNIGPAFENTSAFVLAPEGEFEILPTGAYGEFVFGGEQVFRGYVGRDDLNSTKILKHPQYGRLYRSGDMGRILPDGTLLISGRLDDQVKIRGNRVELGEINAVVSDHPEVSDCATIVIGDNSSNQMLATFWVAKAASTEPKFCVYGSGTGFVSSLYDLLEDALPAYMTPSVLVPVSRLPMTSQGKLDKRLLQYTYGNLDQATKNGVSRSYEIGAHDAPSTPVEQHMAEAVAQTLGMTVASVSRNASFFALGLNSLNAIQLARALQKTLGLNVNVSTVLRHSSIARLSRSISSTEQQKSGHESLDTAEVLEASLIEKIKSALPMSDLAVDAVFPCTPLQEAMLSTTGSDNTDAYCNTMKIHFEGDVAKLKECWEIMLQRHAILRTSFVETTLSSNPFVQAVLRDPPPTWTSENHPISNGNSNHTNGHVNGHVNGHKRSDSPLDVRPQEPKLPGVTPDQPVQVVQSGHDIYLQMHHAVYDGIAVNNLFSELISLYKEESLPSSVSFEPFLAEVVRQNKQDALDFWSSRIGSFQPRPFPPLEEAAAAGEQVFDMSLGISPADVGAFSERHSCTSLSIFQAALAKTIACAQDVTDLCFGNVVSGRSVSVPDVERLIAPCFNTIPVRVELAGLRTNLDLVQSLQKNNLESLPYQLTALRRIQGLSRDPSKHLFDTLLLLQPPAVGDDSWDIEENEDMGMGIPLVIEVVPHGNDLALLVHYMPDKISQPTATTFAKAFISAVKACLRYTSGSITELGEEPVEDLAGKLAPLPIPVIENADANGDADSWTDEETMVREIYAELAAIRTDQISKQTSLYQIGLDSLNAVQVASQLRKRGVKIDAADVMQLQTPTALAKLIGSEQDVEEDVAADSIDFDAFATKHMQQVLETFSVEEDAIEAIRPCTSAQSGMLAQFVQSGGNYYFSQSIYEVPDDVDFEQIQSAWAAVQNKHQVLRMGFFETEDASTPFAMLIYKPDSVPLQTVSHVGEGSSEELSHSMRSSVLDELQLPAWRAVVQNTGESRRMVVSLHHALYDADALELMLSDFAQALRGINLGQPRSIDAVLKMQLSGATEKKNASEQFWSKSLEAAHLFKFPNITPTVVKQSEAQSTEFSSQVTISALETFCRANGVTIQAVGQTVWAQMLAAYLGEPAVTFGTVFSGLSSSATKGVAFPSISTLPVHCDTKQALLHVIQTMVTYNSSAQRHRFTPLSDIQRFAGSPGQALFDTIFVYQRSNTDEDERFDWTAVSDSLGIDYTASMEMQADGKDGLQLRLTYDIAMVPEDHAALILRQFDMLLQSMIGNNPHDLASADLMSIVAPKDAVIPSEVTLLHQFLERGALEHPDKIALEFIYSLENQPKSRKTWTYRELDERANQVAHLIQKHSVQPGSIVSVCMSKSPEATFAFIGILKAGCAFLAMDPDLPLARRKFIAEDSASQLLFVDAGKTDAELAGAVRNVELTEESLTSLPVTAPPVGLIDPTSTSYCLYTSGTTGAPKGCEITHENAVQAMLSFQRLFADHWTSSSRWLQFASYWFDVSVLEHFWSWSVGITMVGAPRDLVLEDLSGFIAAANITHIDLTPSLARLLKPEEVPSLHNHVFITGGEALKQEIIDAWGPYHTIYNGYGPTEATIGCTMNVHIGPEAKPSNIGPAFDNVGAFVLAPETDQPVMRGAVGELCVSGKLVGKGYLNRPDLTAKAFPYLDRLSERVYRTGDLVRLLADDSFSFIGRKDTQAKLRGQRLEIDEIDAVIKGAHGGISDVASLVVKGEREMLVSFIIDSEARSRDLHLAQSAQANDIVAAADQACRDRLPGYMVPTHIIPLSRLPLTVNNKVDAKSLVALFSSLTNQELQKLKGSQGTDRPLRSGERKIAKALSRLLSIDTKDIGASSNVFSLGLSSVSAINLATLLKRSGFENASVANIMSNPTVSGLATTISSHDSKNQLEKNAMRQAQLSTSAFAQRHRSLAAQTLSVNVSNIESVAPCTPLQEGLLADSLKGSHKPYFNAFHYRLIDVDLDRLHEALSYLQSEIPILRTSFIRTDEGFAQVVLREVDLPIHTEELQDESKIEPTLTEEKAKWEALADHEVNRPFEMVLVRSPSETILAFHAHHALYDGISWDLMISKLEQSYASKLGVDFGPSFVEALPYGPLCKRTDAKDFWEQRMKGFHFTPLAQNVQDSTTNGTRASRTLASTSSIEKIRKGLGVSHQAVFQAAFSVAIHQFAPQTQTYGVVASGRSIDFEDADVIIGPMFNTLPYGIDVDPTDSWSKLLQRCHQSNTTVLPYQHTSLREVRKHCRRHPSDPIFDVLFVYQRPEDETEAQADHILHLLPSSTPAEYPLAFDIDHYSSGTAEVAVATQAGVASDEALTELLDKFEAALQCMVDNSEGSIADKFTISRSSTSATPAQQQNLSAQVNGTSDLEWTSDATKLREIIAEVAGCSADDITEHVTIFTLGLDSIDAVKLAARMKKAGIPVPVSKILSAQTIPKILGNLQNTVDADEKSHVASKFSALEGQLQAIFQQVQSQTAQEIERIIPAAPGQEALVAEMIRSDFQEYFNSDVLHLSQGTDIERLKKAWQQAYDASPILRTAFVDVSDPDIDATFAQVVLKTSPLHFDQVEVTSLDDLNDYFEAVKVDVRQSFSKASPLRLAIVTIGSEQYLVLSLSHAQYDGHSIGLLHADITAAYNGTLEPRPSYDEAIEQALGATSDESLAFWRHNLAGAKLSRFSSTVAIQTPTTHRSEINAILTSIEARKLCSSLGVSLQSLAQASWALLLATYLEDIDVIYGVVLACRDSEEAEQVLFPTMNTVPARVTLHGSASQMLRDVQDNINAMRQHQRTPLRHIQSACADLLQSSKSRPKQGLFDTLFMYQSRGEMNDEATEALYESAIADANVEYPVAVEAEAVGDKLVLRAACKSSVLDAEGTQLLLERFDTVLSFLASDQERPTVDFSGDDVSICGLPPFTLRSEALSRQTTREQYIIDDSDEESEDDIAVIEAIRSALAQVAKMPMEDVPSHATIQSIGIDSISAIKVASLLRKQSIKLSLIGQKEPAANHPEAPQDVINTALGNIARSVVQQSLGVTADDIESILPTTAGQLYMLSLWRKTGGELFFPTFKYQIRTQKSVDDLRDAWKQVVTETAILRTQFCQTKVPGVPVVQVVLKTSTDSLHLVDAPPASQQQPFAHLIAKPADEGFDLQLQIHHALYDAVSLPLLMQRLGSILEGDALPKPGIDFSDYLALGLNSASLESSQRFWTEYLQGTQHAQLRKPNEAATKKVQIFKPAAFASCVDLERQARSAGVSTQALFFAAYAKVYSKHILESGRDTIDVVVGIYIANRTHLPELDQLAAPTLNLLPLRVKTPGVSSVLDSAKQIDQDLRQITTAANSSASLAEIYRWTGVKIDTFVNFLKMPEQDEQLSSDNAITDANDEWNGEVARVHEPEKPESFEMPPELREFEVNEAYQHAVDVELAVKDGKLSVGIFCLEDMMGLDEAVGMTEEFVGELQQLTGEH
ncbi:hypothetical protein CBER1_04278 [Cercospora berteroae]|uniref:Carrier domain-containing protein n=1 Tax=Cercospora berteroae TaxID=357750 RepID=A0A2S6C6C5_9PEZI|nr:hypothetical protein CBER1_04278 [Cercospora berteroae]